VFAAAAPSAAATPAAASRRSRRPAASCMAQRRGEAGPIRPRTALFQAEAAGGSPALAGCATPGRDPCSARQQLGVFDLAPQARPRRQVWPHANNAFRRSGAAFACNAAGVGRPDHRPPKNSVRFDEAIRGRAVRWSSRRPLCWAQSAASGRPGNAGAATVLAKAGQMAQPAAAHSDKGQVSASTASSRPLNPPHQPGSSNLVEGRLVGDDPRWGLVEHLQPVAF